MRKERLVCDRCGMKQQTCIHQWDEDYALTTREEYKAQCKIILLVSLMACGIVTGTLTAIMLWR